MEFSENRNFLDCIMPTHGSAGHWLRLPRLDRIKTEIDYLSFGNYPVETDRFSERAVALRRHRPLALKSLVIIGLEPFRVSALIYLAIIALGAYSYFIAQVMNNVY